MISEPNDGEIARKLSDCYGIKGGILRREGRLKEAADCYEKGAAIEQDPRFDIIDSYNIVNAILFGILAEPDTLANEETKTKVEKARRLVESQVNVARRSQWWAWADYGLLSLLSGDANQARHAYTNFQRCGARPADYDSTKSTLLQAQQYIQNAHPEVANRIRDAISWLENERPPELSSTQVKLLTVIASELPSIKGIDWSKLRREMIDQFGSETRPHEMREQLEVLIQLNLVAEFVDEGGDKKYRLTDKGDLCAPHYSGWYRAAEMNPRIGGSALL